MSSRKRERAGSRSSLERWRSNWQEHLEQSTIVVRPADDTAAHVIIARWWEELVSEMQRTREKLQGTPYEIDAPLTLYGPNGIYGEPGQPSEVVDERMMMGVASYETSRVLYLLLRKELRHRGERSATEVAVSIQNAWADFAREAEPVLVYNLLRLLGRNEDAFDFLTAVKLPKGLKLKTRDQLLREAQARGKSPLEILREDLPGQIGSLPHIYHKTITTEGVDVNIQLGLPLLPTTPEGIAAFHSGIEQGGRKHSLVGLVAEGVRPERSDLIGTIWQASDADIEMVPTVTSQDPLDILIIDEAIAKRKEEVRSLPEKQRRDMELRIQGYSYAEIAAVTGKGIEGVSRSLKEARKKIEKKSK